MTLTMICSWCKLVMVRGDAPMEAPTTHGCCDPCAKLHFPLYWEEVYAPKGDSLILCRTCSGHGSVMSQECGPCGGTGYTEQA